MEGAARDSSEKVQAALQSFPTGLADLVAVAMRLVDCMIGEDAWALQRLLYAEAGHFPGLYESVLATGANRTADALAGRLARPANAGHLRIADPVRAAAHFQALIGSELPALTALGSRPIGGSELEQAVAAGVDTFLRAFAPSR
ncbi:TetR/AcrR family transcriptional regulator C-terminal domain-containing protein [Sphaerisporangium sp. NPDC051017]|uniref:TetR/AcrR family transcriptional regulator C-terminal domain-containing protein n=1 Tax=Sphaerisporangium sp. NPDC051017 TaxID=3154636 RepID=UPI003447C71A